MSDPEGHGSALDDHFRDHHEHLATRSLGRRALTGCLPVLLVLAVLGALGYVAVDRGVDWVQDRFGEPADFAGPGTGQVMFEVVSGQSIGEIAGNLEEQGVVESAEAFTDAASADQRATGIQAGFYQLKQEMAAQDALDVLVDPKAIVTTAVTIPEGLPVREIVKILGNETDYKAGRFQRILDEGVGLGLPAYAKGNAEGYLFPATYPFAPHAKPKGMLQAMVGRWQQAADDAGLEAGARQLGYTPHQVMTVASLVEAEARGDDMPKVARVIYNRIENPGTAGTIGRLQLDATVNYAHGRDLGARTTSSQRQINSPYNTYRVSGLPPGPIEAPGQAAIEAAINPADGDWYYYVTVNLRTGETKFAETAQQHEQHKAELDEYCRNESERC